MIEQVEAEFFHDFQTKGYSRPARLTCRRADGRQVEVFIKFAAGAVQAAVQQVGRDPKIEIQCGSKYV